MNLIMQHYLEDRREWAASLGVKVIYSDKPFKKIEGGFKASGYFNEDVLFLALGNPNYVTTAIHEYCHVDQWAAGSPLWDKTSDADVVLWSDFVAGKSLLDREAVKRATRHIRNLELDCEKRTIRQIEKYDLPVEIPRYVQRANAYMFYHSAMAVFRGYAKHKSPYQDERVWKTMPKHFLTTEEYDNPSQDFLLRCRIHCY